MWLPIEATAKEGRQLEREHLRNARSFGTQQAEERQAQEQRKAAKLNRVLDEAKSRAKTGLKTLGIGEGECRVHVKVGRKWGGKERGASSVHKMAWATGAVGWGVAACLSGWGVGAGSLLCFVDTGYRVGEGKGCMQFRAGWQWAQDICLPGLLKTCPQSGQYAGPVSRI